MLLLNRFPFAQHTRHTRATASPTQQQRWWRQGLTCVRKPLQKTSEKEKSPPLPIPCRRTRASSSQLLPCSKGTLEAAPCHTRAHRPLRADPVAAPGTFLSSWNLCKSEATTSGLPCIGSHWALTLPSGFHSLPWATVVPAVSRTITG